MAKSGARIGLALGGGAARGLAHLGVLEVLEEAGLRPAAVSGTSIGALVGALWAVEGSARVAIERVDTFVNSEAYLKGRMEFLATSEDESQRWGAALSKTVRRGIVLGWSFFRESFVSRREYFHNVEHLLPDQRLELLAPSFTAVATDLRTRRSVFLRTGDLRRAIAASGAVPGLMPPVDQDGLFLVDGAVSEKVPVRALFREPVDVIVGVDVSPEALEEAQLGTGTESLARSKQVTEWQLRASRTAFCDLLLCPDVLDIHWADFSGALPAIERGRAAMREALPALRRALRKARWRRLFRGTTPQRGRRHEARGYFGDPPVEI